MEEGKRTLSEGVNGLEMKVDFVSDHLLEEERNIFKKTTRRIEKAWKNVGMQKAALEAQKEAFEKEKEKNALIQAYTERLADKELSRLKKKMDRQENQSSVCGRDLQGSPAGVSEYEN
ncbi:hypothetical protein MHYP_G00305130 [Metynnis hypsauchen]